MKEKIVLKEFSKKKRVEKLVTLVDGKWKWKEGDKLSYNDAWASSLSSRLLDVGAARDCIQRACGSSWWE